MKVEIDMKPVDSNHQEPLFILRLYPENNEDITKMEWGLAVMSSKLDRIERAGHTSSFHYMIPFKVKENEWKEKKLNAKKE